MKFIFEEYDEEQAVAELVYIKEEYSFRTLPRRAGCVTSISINDLELGLSDTGEILNIEGLCPIASWKEKKLNLPPLVKAKLKIEIEETIVPGMSFRVNKLEKWPVLIDNNLGWICIGNPEADNKLFLFSSFAAVSIVSNEIKGLWLKL